MTDQHRDLQVEVRRAIDDSQRELRELRKVAHDATKRLRAVKHSKWTRADESDLYRLVEQFAQDTEAHLDHQQQVLDTYNIAFFGRTGAGKSTLMSAFGKLDGGYVSPGESDWTVDVTEIAWQGCRLWDTPGINGWGRTQRRADLEDTARKAVEVADVVLLCFDSQSQQASEFDKVARWVRQYGKPVIAVLNVRNQMWRHPAKVSSSSARENQSRSVREHTDTIRTELARIGLGGTPVVAIQSRRALFARATEPFNGPALKNFEHDRETFGVDYLLENSNFPVLEALITESIAHGGTDLRRRSLREGMRAFLTRMRSEAGDIADAAPPEIARLEARVSGLFQVLGYPSPSDGKKLLGKDIGLIGELEKARNQPFTESLEGSLQRRIRHLIQSHLQPVRQETTRRAEDEVNRAVREGTPLDEELFKARVHREDDVARAVDAIWDATAGYLMNEFKFAAGVAHANPVNIDLNADGIPINSDSMFRKRAAWALRTVSVAAGGATVVLAVPSAANFWNPAGWGGFAVMVAATAVSSVAKFVGDRFADSDAQRRAELHSDGIREALTAVRSHFDSIEARLEAELVKEAWKVGGPLVVAAARGALHLREQSVHIADLDSWLAEQADTIEPSVDPLTVVQAAQRQVQAGHAGRSGNSLWLGEDWLERGSHAQELAVDHLTDEARHVFGNAHLADAKNLDEFLGHAWPQHTSKTLQEWIERVNPSGSDVTPPAGNPTVVVVGDYSSGKSSLVKRLLVELGGHVPDDLHVRGGVATQTARAYDLDTITLVDTPGFQSGQSEHDARALEATADASLVVVVLHVNLLIGDMSLIEQIAKGTDLTVAKGGRILFVVNRADELGVDPATAPADFQLLKARKATELKEALASRDIDVAPEQIHVLAGDPFGAVGARVDITRDDYAANSAWDGVRALADLLSSSAPQTGVAGCTIADADAAANGLLAVQNDLGERVIKLEASCDEAGRVLDATGNGIRDAHLMVRGWQAQLDRIIGPEADKAKSRVRQLTADTLEQLEPIVNEWAANEELLEKIGEFRKRAVTELNSWSGEQSSTVGRRIDTATTIEAMIDLGAGFEARTGESFIAQAAERAGSVGKYGAKFARAAGKRDVVYGAGKAVGVKFKPWGAVKAGSRIAKVAPILAAAAAAADGYSMYAAHSADQKVESERTRGVDFIETQVARLMEAATGMVDEQGSLMYELTTRTTELATHRERFDCVMQATGSEIAVCGGRRDEIAELLTEYRALSNEDDGSVQQ
ncbi:GTPase [Gordonia rhizosphera]|uniref:G domain-containing protein n=1 Tax=Gordonia rhizosphera NBRC 16068 TaxID=1108045 RepID=K6W0M8_9ACTN|nr:GTPase [Gordonia rhizosphera]GAB92725.1 hypothetical protein GORHZ_188_00170 [Gordonia rhizosphera NBRC 16068]